MLHIKKFCFIRVDEQRVSTTPTQYFFEVFVYSIDNVMKFASREPEEDFCVVHIADRFAVFWDSRPNFPQREKDLMMMMMFWDSKDVVYI